MHITSPSLLVRSRRAVFVTVAGTFLTVASLTSPTVGSWLRPAQAAEAEAEADVDTAVDEVQRLAAHIAETWKMPLPTCQRIVEAAFSQAEARNISPTLILAVVAQESSFKATARSSYGAQGLMQVSARHHPDKLRGLQHSALYRPETNIRVGAQVLAEYLEQHGGRLDPALKQYSGNARSYPRKIRAFWAQLEQVRRMPAAEAPVPNA